MGRTKRKRKRGTLSEKILNMDNDLATVGLKKWMFSHNWRNETNLKLRSFSLTGRGLTSSTQMQENDILITVPYDLLITHDSILNSVKEVISPRNHGLKIHDLLTLFLVIEKQKENSLWKAYIESLPLELPALPWLATTEEINSYPTDLRITSMKNRENFLESKYRVTKSIKEHYGCVLDANLFKWGYVLVNTRAVYVDPQIAAVNDFLRNILIDEPSMALCPFLDMFNHHFLAKTEAKVVEKDGRLVYQLQTFSKYKKYEQIFISYGAHSNIKLVMEYGFFIPGNVMDVAEFDLKDILSVFKVNVEQKRYKFILDHALSTELSIGWSGISFNLKAVLYILFYVDYKNYSAIIFSDSYPEDFLQSVAKWTLKLLDYKLQIFENDYVTIRNSEYEKSGNALLIENFLKYRVSFVNDLRKTLYVN